MKSMFRELENCQKIMRENFNKPLKMTNSDEEAFKKATHCHICKKKNISLQMKNQSEITAKLPENIVVQLIKIVI